MSSEFYKGLVGIQDEVNQIKLMIAEEEDINENLKATLLELEKENQDLAGNVVNLALEVQIAQTECHSGSLKKMRLDKEIEEISVSIQDTAAAVERKINRKEKFKQQMYTQRDNLLCLQKRNYEFYLKDPQVAKYENANAAYLELMEALAQESSRHTTLQGELIAFQEAAAANWSSFRDVCVQIAKSRHELEPLHKELNRLTMQCNQLKQQKQNAAPYRKTSLTPALGNLSLRQMPSPAQSPLARKESSLMNAKLQALRQQYRPSSSPVLKLPQFGLQVARKEIPRATTVQQVIPRASVSSLKSVSRNHIDPIPPPQRLPAPTKVPPRVLTQVETNIPAPTPPKIARIEKENKIPSKPSFNVPAKEPEAPAKAPAPVFEFKKPISTAPASVHGSRAVVIPEKKTSSTPSTQLSSTKSSSHGISQKSQDVISSSAKSLSGKSTSNASKENSDKSMSSILGFECSSSRSLFGSPTSGTNLGSNDSGFLSGFFSPSPGPQTGGSNDDFMANIFGFSPLGNSDSASGSSSGCLF